MTGRAGTRLDRRRAVIDLGTLLVSVMVLFTSFGWDFSRTEGASPSLTGHVLNDVSLAVIVGSQLVQALAGQLLFRRMSLGAVGRASVMVGIWSVTAGAIILVPSRDMFWACFFATIVVPLNGLARLGVLAAVKALIWLGAVISRRRRVPSR